MRSDPCRRIARDRYRHDMTGKQLQAAEETNQKANARGERDKQNQRPHAR